MVNADYEGNVKKDNKDKVEDLTPHEYALVILASPRPVVSYERRAFCVAQL